jgi:hypothetical protein
MYFAAYSDSVERGFERFFAYVPQLVGALVLLLVGYFVAKILQSVAKKGLQQLRFDRTLHTSSAGRYIDRMVTSPSVFVSRIVFWLVFFGFISVALTALNLPVLDRIVNGIYSYIPNVIAAIVIFLVAGAVSAGAATLVRTTMGKTPTAKLISAVIPAITMGIAVFMILDQLNIAENIVTITFTAIMASISLGLALAFGLGGRDVAKQILEQAYQAGQENAAAAKRDVARAKSNAKEKLNDVTS